MSYYATANDIETKLEELLAGHNMVHEFKTKQHPIVLVVSPDASLDAQTEIYSNAEGAVSSYDARLRLLFALDGSIEIQTDNRFVVSEALMNKIKNLGKKYRDAFTYAFFADRCNDKLLISSTVPEAVDNTVDTVDAFDGFFDGEETQE